jgi:sugar fermentation stimulation protein A
MPDYHTDLAFSRTFLDLRNRLTVLPVAIRWKHDLSISSKVKSLEIPWDYLEREVDDRGSYLLILKLRRAARIGIGRHGTFSFKRGYYIYVGSAMRNLTARVARHQRLHKRLHWHVDYLRQKTEVVAVHPIRSSQREECSVARAYSKRYRSGPPGFGSSDCSCAAHLFHLDENPMNDPLFHHALQRFRMRPPKE